MSIAATTAPSLSTAEVVRTMRASRGFAHKRDISAVTDVLSRCLPGGRAHLTLGADQGVQLGDDCAVIPDPNGHLLFAIEGLVDDFVAAMPWFAGYSAVMVNLSDIAAMGGRPIAVVDAMWSAGSAQAEPILQGMAAASAAYGVPIVGGHSNQQADRAQLAVAVLGRAQSLLSSFAARPGHTLLMAINTITMTPAIYKNMPYDTANDFAPVIKLTEAGYALAVHPSVTAKDMSALVAQSKKSPGSMNYASPGNGTPHHLAMELFKSASGLDAIHVPYKGIQGALTDLVGGHIDAIFGDVAILQPHVNSGTIRALAGNSLAATWLSHAIVDAAIFGVGYHILAT